MNRQIKFEYGFESVNGIVKKVYYLHDIPNIKNKCDVWDILPLKYVRQFTGLTDKNGKECYEGDLSIIEGNLCEVKFGTFFTCGWDFKIIGKMGSYNMGDVCRNFNSKGCKDFEIIGNIFENPELLCN